MNTVVREVSWVDKIYSVKENISYHSKVELAKLIFAMCYIVDEKAGFVVRDIDADAWTKRAFVAAYVSEEEETFQGMDIGEFMDEYEGLADIIMTDVARDSCQRVMDLVETVRKNVKAGVAARASLNYKIGKIIDEIVPEVEELMSTIPNADEISTKMLSAARMFKDSEQHANPTKKAGNNILNFAKK